MKMSHMNIKNSYWLFLKTYSPENSVEGKKNCLFKFKRISISVELFFLLFLKNF